jgi:hypothetical protein
LFAVVLAVTVVTVMAQTRAPLSLDAIVGVWNVSYEDGAKSTFTVSKNGDGTPRIMVTSLLGDSEVRDIEIEGDTITFHRTIVDELRGNFRVNYVAKLVDGKLVGTGQTIATAGTTAPLPFSASRAE